MLEAASVAAQRQALRDRTRSARLALDPQARASATAAACARAIAALAEVEAAATVAIFWAMRGELDPAAIAAALDARGVALAYPVVVGPGQPLRFHRAAPAELIDAAWGLREPAASAPVVDPATLAALVVPGLVFDRRGYRLGWGKGYYDRTLPLCGDALRVSVAFEHQVVDDVSPMSHDLPVHLIATEVALHEGAPRPRGPRT